MSGGRRRTTIGLGAALAIVVVVLAAIALNRSDSGESDSVHRVEAKPSAGAGDPAEKDGHGDNRKDGHGDHRKARGGESAGDAKHVGRVSLHDIEHEAIELPAGRPGALFFSTSDCTTCIPSAKALAELKTRLGDRIDAVYISMDPEDPESRMRERRESIADPSPYPFAVDESGELAPRYGVTSVGTVLVYDSHGTIVERLVEPSGDRLTGAFREAGVT